VLGEEVMSGVHVFEWRKRVSGEMVGDEFGSRPGLPTTTKSDINVEKVRTLLWND
jgi:hypothetical protein